MELVDVQDVRWNRGDRVRAGDCVSVRRRKRKSTGNFFFHHRTLSLGKRVEFIVIEYTYIYIICIYIYF